MNGGRLGEGLGVAPGASRRDSRRHPPTTPDRRPESDLLNATREGIRPDRDDSRMHHVPDTARAGRSGWIVALCRSDRRRREDGAKRDKAATFPLAECR